MTKSCDFLEPGAGPELLAEGMGWLEGPAWVPSWQLFIFSDIINNKVMSWSPERRELAVFADQVEHTNGRTIDLAGDVVECSHGLRAVQRRSASTGEVTVLVDGFNGVRFNSPNDVVVKSDGTIWFSDPAYGIEMPGEGHPGKREYADRWVFRYDEQSGELWPVVTDIIAPNGLAFSPDEQVLYVCDTSASGGEEGPGRFIRAYDVRDGRFAKFGRTIIEIDNEVPDGIRVDEQGRIWSSAGDGVRIFDPDGTQLGFIEIPVRVGNLCWGGEDGHTLFLCASDRIYSVRTTTTSATWGRW